MIPITEPRDREAERFSVCRLPHREFLAFLCQSLDLAHLTSSDMRGEPYAPLSFLEVGVREGDSFAAAWDAVKTLGRVDLVDTWGREHGGTGRGSHAHIVSGVVEPRTRAGHSIAELTFHDRDSKEVLPELYERAKACRTIRRDNPHVFDVVHIDGDHSTGGAALDLVNGWALTRSVLVVHDLFMASVANALRIFASDPENRADLRSVDASFMDSGAIAFWREGHP